MLDTASSAEVGESNDAEPEPTLAVAVAEPPKVQEPRAAPAAETLAPSAWPRLRFELNTAWLGAEARETLDRLADHLKQHPFAEVVLEGHTDDLGGPEVNHSLSRSRAIRARQRLVAQGVDPAQIEIHNFGASKPVVPGRSAEARAQNRRVEITVRERIQ
jgi:outer membrane protein OmpA-like peptidoglycan-associated protein